MGLASAAKSDEKDSTAPGPSVDAIVAVLDRCVKEQRLAPFYPLKETRLREIAKHIDENGAIKKLAGKWSIPVEKAIEMSKLALYDIVLVIHESESTRKEGNEERFNSLKNTLSQVVYAAELLDPSVDEVGVKMQFVTSASSVCYMLRKEAYVSGVVDSNPFNTHREIGIMWSEVLEPNVLDPAKKGALNKPVLIITLRDGGDQQEAVGVARIVAGTKAEMKSTRYGVGGVSFEFAVVRNDEGALAFIAGLEGAPVDTTRSFEGEAAEKKKVKEEMSQEDWLVKVCLGAIDRNVGNEGEAKGLGARVRKLLGRCFKR